MAQLKNLALSVWLLCSVACNSKGGASTGAPPPPPSATIAAATASAPATAPASAVAPAAASAAPADDAKGLTYGVLGVAANHVLNVREKPDTASKKVYSYAPTVKTIRAA